MIAKDRDPFPPHAQIGTRSSAMVPSGLPAAASCVAHSLPTGEVLEVLSVPLEPESASPSSGAIAETDAIETMIRRWSTEAASPQAPIVFVPLYGCHVTWASGRAAICGPRDRLGLLEAALVEFAGIEADLRSGERQATSLLDSLEGDVASSLSIEPTMPDRRAEMAARHREAVAVGRRLMLLAPLVHAPPVHPPTLASQLGERLRERARLVERHEFATQRAELAERVAEACGQRALEVGIARRQIGLEWAIVVLLVVQTVMLVVELLAQQATP